MKNLVLFALALIAFRCAVVLHADGALLRAAVCSALGCLSLYAIVVDRAMRSSL
jgi:hypothetical protein